MSTSVAQNFQFEIGLDFWLEIKFATRRFKICKFPNQMDSGVVLEKMAGKIDKFVIMVKIKMFTRVKIKR